MVIVFGHRVADQAGSSENGRPEMKFYTKAQALINSMRTEEEGATAVEYGLMVSLIAVVIIAAVTVIGTNLDVIFGEVGAALVTPA